MKDTFKNIATEFGYLNEVTCRQKSQELADSYSTEELQDRLDQIMREMEQEAEPEGGPIANMYADEMEAYEGAIKISKGGSDKPLTYGQATGQEPLPDGTYLKEQEAEADPEMSKDAQKIADHPLLDKINTKDEWIDIMKALMTHADSISQVSDSLKKTTLLNLVKSIGKEGFDKSLNEQDDEDLTFEPEGGEYVDEIELDDLDFETLKASFPKFYQKVKFTRTQPNGEEGPYYEDAISFPNLDDSRTVIGDASALEDWKNKVSRRFGNVEIVFNDEAKNWFDRVFVSDDAFNDARDGFIRGKMSAMQRDQELGRSIDESFVKKQLQKRAGIIK